MFLAWVTRSSKWHWWGRYHPKCASGGAVGRINRGRARGIWWGGNAKRVGVLVIKDEMLGISPELPRFLLPDARHTTTISSESPRVPEDEDPVGVNHDTEIKTEFPQADGLYLRKTREAQVTL